VIFFDGGFRNQPPHGIIVDMLTQYAVQLEIIPGTCKTACDSTCKHVPKFIRGACKKACKAGCKAAAEAGEEFDPESEQAADELEVRGVSIVAQ